MRCATQNRLAGYNNLFLFVLYVLILIAMVSVSARVAKQIAPSWRINPQLRSIFRRVLSLLSLCVCADE